MTTPVYLTGFEHGVATLTTNGGGLFNTVSGSTVSVQSTTKNTGSYALKLAVSSSAPYVVKTLTSNARMVTRVYFYLTATPTDDSAAVFVHDTSGANLLYAVVRTDGKFYVGFYTTFAEEQASAGTVSLNAWHYVDVNAYCGGTTWTFDWKLDGTTQTSGSYGSHSAETFSNINLGSQYVYANTYNMYIDDVVVSNTSGDYPIGPGGTEALVPASDGSHNAGTNCMENNSGTDIGVTTAYDKINSIPPSSTAYIRQAASGTGNYAEVLFGDIASTHSAIIGAFGILSYTSATTTSNNGGCIISKDSFSTSTTIWGASGALSDYSDGSTSNLYYKSAKLANVTDDTTVNALKARVGYSSDVSPNPYWIDLIVEVAYTTGASTYNATATLAGTSSVVTAAKNSISFIATLAGTSALTTAGKNSILFTSTFAGSSALTAVGKNAVPFTSTLAGTSALTAVGKNAIPFTSTLAGTSLLTILGTVTGQINFTATLAGTSSLTTVGKDTIPFTSTLAGSSALTTAGKNTNPFTSTLAGTSSLTIAGKNSILFTSTLAGTSVLTTVGKDSIPFTSTLAGTSLITVLGTVTGQVNFTATLAGTSSLITAGKNSIPFTSTLAGTSDLTAVGKVSIPFTSTLAGTSLLTVLGTVTGRVDFTATLAGTSSLITAGKNSIPFTSTLAGTSDLTTVGKVFIPFTSTLAGTSSLNVIYFVEAIPGSIFLVDAIAHSVLLTDESLSVLYTLDLSDQLADGNFVSLSDVSLSVTYELTLNNRRVNALSISDDQIDSVSIEDA